MKPPVPASSICRLLIFVGKIGCVETATSQAAHRTIIGILSGFDYEYYFECTQSIITSVTLPLENKLVSISPTISFSGVGDDGKG